MVEWEGSGGWRPATTCSPPGVRRGGGASDRGVGGWTPSRAPREPRRVSRQRV